MAEASSQGSPPCKRARPNYEHTEEVYEKRLRFVMRVLTEIPDLTAAQKYRDLKEGFQEWEDEDSLWYVLVRQVAEAEKTAEQASSPPPKAQGTGSSASSPPPKVQPAEGASGSSKKELTEAEKQEVIAKNRQEALQRRAAREALDKQAEDQQVFEAMQWL